MTAKDELDQYRATGQYRITQASLAIYFVVLVLFLIFMDRVSPDQRLTIAVLLLTPLAGIINSAAAFWLNRSREDGAEKPPTIQTSSTPGGGSKAVVTPAGTPVRDTAQTPEAAAVASDAPPPDNQG